MRRVLAMLKDNLQTNSLHVTSNFILALKMSAISSNRSELLSKLTQLPPTNHITASFAIDVPLVTSTIVKFVVRGVFEESKLKIRKNPRFSCLSCNLGVGRVFELKQFA